MKKINKYNRLLVALLLLVTPYSVEGAQTNYQVEFTKLIELNDFGGAKIARIVNDIAYVVADGGLVIYDVSDPSNTQLLGQYLSKGYLGHSLMVTFPYAITASHDYGMVIINTSDPTNPVFIGNFGGSADGLYVVDDIVYLTDSVNGLTIYNISNPTGPIQLGNYRSAGYHQVYVDHECAFVSKSEQGFMILNISDPSDITEIAEFNDGNFVYSTIAKANHVYTGGIDGIKIIDITEINNPVKIGEYFDEGFAGYIQLIDDILYVADGEDGIELIDVSNPKNPREIGQFNDEGAVLGIQVVGSYVFAGDQNDGLEIIHMEISVSTTDSAIFSGWIVICSFALIQQLVLHYRSRRHNT
ncbi:MAG: LVIVD repeat-containing protein [Candidatus Kariarchaeaceae archaeon]|jgi:hypothetical protein